MGGIKNKLSNKAKTLLSSLSLKGAVSRRLTGGSSKSGSRLPSFSQPSEMPDGQISNTSKLSYLGLYAWKTIGSLRPTSRSLSLAKGRQMSVAHRWGRITKHVGIACFALALISTIGLNLYRTYSSNDIRTNAAGGEESGDTGVASLDRVDVVQAGTGQSVTIDGTTMDETAYGTDTTRRTILNNNVVRYNAALDVATPGTITVSMTLPANNTIDESSVSTAAGCLTSSLSKQTVDGKESYTNNKATCTLNPTGAGQTNWQVTAYLWGGNGDSIQPTFTLSEATQPVKPEAIEVMGKMNYEVRLTNATYNHAFWLGYNLDTSPDIGLYVPESSTGVLGVEPIDSYVVKLDTEQVPTDWVARECGAAQSGGLGVNTSQGIILSNKENYSGRCEKSADGRSLVIEINNLVTATLNYSLSNEFDGYFYSANGFNLAIPTSSIPGDGASFTLKVLQVSVIGANSGETAISYLGPTLSFWVTGKASGRVRIFPQNMLAWSQNYSQTGPVYSGQTIFGSIAVTNKVFDGYNANNLDVCIVWDANELSLESVSPRSHITDGGGAYDFGVVSKDVISSIFECGRVGDGKAGFYGSLDDAKQYADDIGADVNVVRMYLPKLDNTTDDVGFLKLFWDVAKNSSANSQELMYTHLYAETDEWSNSISSDYYKPRLVPGLLAHTITAEPSSTSPNTEDHITITPRTYNMDTNTKITVTLPSGLTPKDNSFYVSDYRLVEGSDYTVTPRDNGGYTIVFDADQIAAHSGLPITGEPAIMPGESGNDTDLPIARDNDGNGIVRDGIEFDVLVDSNTPTPSTLTITSTTSGTGTNLAASTFRIAQADIAVATQKTFGYSLSGSASSIYVGDDLTYTLSNTNTLDDSTTNLTSINVLPYDGDSRGTTGLDGYSVDELVVSDNLGDNPVLYYTTDQIVRDLERTDPLALDGRSSDEVNNNLASSINWAECSLDDTGRCTNLPTDIAEDITAVKYAKPTMASGETVSLVYTLTDMQMSSPNEAESQTINNSLNYTMVEAISNPATDTSTTTTAYLGSLLLLSLDKDALEVEIEPNVVQIGNGNTTSPDSLTNVLSLVAKTASGYNLTMRLTSEDAGLVNATADTNQTYVIPTIDTQPTAGRAGWSVTLDGASWHSLPTINDIPLTVASSTVGGSANKTIPVTYGIATANSTVAGTYTNKVIYTVTAAI